MNTSAEHNSIDITTTAKAVAVDPESQQVVVPRNDDATEPDWLKNAMKLPEEPVDTVPWANMLHLNRSSWLLGTFQVALIILFACCAGGEIPSDRPGSITAGYNMFIGVCIMMFIGFGYLMTFMKWYGLGAVGFTMMVTAIGLQWAVFTESFFEQIAFEKDWHFVSFDIYALLDALYAISALLIAFGALIGKISSFQLVVLAIFCLVGHSFNYEVLMLKVLNLDDMGGTYPDHMYGAYFGLTVAFLLDKPKVKDPEGGTSSDLFSLLGTLFLWIYWPSFVAGAAPQDSVEQGKAISNTILALSASTVAGFWLSSTLSHNKRYRPVDVQNATLAGGVAIGCVAPHLSPFGAIMVGIAAGLVSAFGFNKVQPYLLERIGLHDTCGIHNLHAMPSVIGGIASVIVAGYYESTDPLEYHNRYTLQGHGQWWRQLVAIPLCITFAMTWGLLVGTMLRHFGSLKDNEEYRDDSWWETQPDFKTSIHTELALGLSSIHSELRGKSDGSFRKEFASLSEHFSRRARMSVNM